MRKLEMTPEEKSIHIKELARLRAARFYAKNKDLEKFKTIRKGYTESDKQIIKDHSPVKPVQNQPVDKLVDPAAAPSSLKKIKFIIKYTSGAKKEYVIPKISAAEVKQFMIQNPEYVLDRAKQTQLPEKTFNDYTGRLLTLAKEIDGLDNYVGAFVNADKTTKTLKNLINPKTNEIYGHNTITKKITVLFSSIRALNRAGLLKPLSEDEINKLFDKYDALLKQKNAERAVIEYKNANNPEYAVPTWTKYENVIVAEFGETSIEHLIAVLYRYNTVRNDYVLQKIHNKTFKDGDGDGFYIGKYPSGVRFITNRKKGGDNHGISDYTFDKRVSAIIRSYIRKNNIKEGEPLIPHNSINNIVKNMMDKAGVKMPPNAKAISVFRNIDSGIDKNMDAEALAEKANRSGHSVNTKLYTYGRKTKETTPDVSEKTVIDDPPENAVVSTTRATRATTKKK